MNPNSRTLTGDSSSTIISGGSSSPLGDKESRIHSTSPEGLEPSRFMCVLQACCTHTHLMRSVDCCPSH